MKINPRGGLCDESPFAVNTNNLMEICTFGGVSVRNKYFIFTTLSLLTLFSSALEADSRAEKFDIRGIYLGMPVEMAVERLNDIGEFQARAVKEDISGIRGSRIRGLVYYGQIITPRSRGARSANRESFKINAYAPPNKNVVSYIERSISYSHNKPILYQQFESSLIKKYGKPHLVFAESSGAPVFSWSTDSKGKPIKSRSVVAGCIQARSEHPYRISSIKQASGKLAKCGFVFVARLDVTRDRKYVLAYFSLAYNMNDILKNNARTVLYTERLAQQLEKEKEQRAKQSGAPRL